MSDIYKFNLTAVLLSATVISTPSQASILPPTPSEHRDLLSTISLAVTDGVKQPQLEQRASFAPTQDTGNRLLHRLGGEHRDLLGTISLAQIYGRGASPLKRRQLASVCFITDAGDCGSLEWEGEGELDNAEKCRTEGYVDTPCGAGLIPIGTCPYDSNWHSQCGCPSDYDKTCTGADEQGKGDACEGKYKECCNLCTGYDYTEDNIPSGYVKTDSCESCNGTKYKARCDVSEGGYMDCGEVVGVGGSCTDDSGTYYKQCNCPLNYEWNDETKTCTCATSFKYDCQGSGYADTQTGNTCDNKYSSCDCAEGFVWDGESGMCVCDGVDWCALNQDCTALGYAQQTCPKWSIKCPYDTSFVKCIDCPPSFKEECKGTGQIGEGQNCDGKYRSCGCNSSYQYTCTGANETGSGTACGGKYTKCTCKSGYTWKNGACQKQVLNGAVGDLYYCNGTKVGIKTSSMNFYVAMKDLGTMDWKSANSQCSSYTFCGNVTGILPTKEQLKTLYNNKSQVNTLLSTNGGTQLTNDYYWSSIRGGSLEHYVVHMSDGNEALGSNMSSYSYYVRPVLTSW